MNSIFTFFRESSFGRFFIPLGIILIIVACFLFIGINNTKNYIKTDAIVSKTELEEEEYYDGDMHHEATYKVYVKYKVDGKEYEEEYGIFSGYKKGDKVTISYNPTNPREIAQPISIIVPFILWILGGVSIISGVVSITNAIKKQKKLKLQEEEWKNAN